MQTTSVTAIAEMSGDDEEDTRLLHAALAEAREYLGGMTWYRGVKETYFGLGVGGVVAVFLFRIDPAPDVDEWLWVVVGDLPSAYLVTDEAPTPLAALEVYCELMDEWVEVVRRGGDLDEVYPVAAEASPENAADLARRIAFLRSEVIPAFR